ncbi:uncharacterized protein LOC135401675 [Ornithodoros turicata]
MAADVTFSIGEEFASFTELHRRIQLFQQKNSVQLYIRSSRKIQAAQVRSTDGYNPELKFAEIYYACVRGGRKFQSRGNPSASVARHYGRAEVSSSRQINCPFHIKIRCTRDGQKLYIKDFNSVHNHGTTEQDAVVCRSRTRQYWPTEKPSSPPPCQPSPLAPKTKTLVTALVPNKDGTGRQLSLPILSEHLLPKDPVLFQLLSSPQTPLSFQNLFLVPKNSNVVTPSTVVVQSSTPPDLKDDQSDSIPDVSDSLLEPECILQCDEDKCVVPCDESKGDGKNGVIIESINSVLNGKESPSRRGLKGTAAGADRFLVTQADLQELMRFCSRCGSKADIRSDRDARTGTLTIKYECAEGHQVERKFEKAQHAATT